MSKHSSPSNETTQTMGRRLGRALRQARKDAGLTQKKAASKLSWSVSKVMRIEQGAAPVSPRDVSALLELYEVIDQQRVNNLVSLAEELLENTVRLKPGYIIGEYTVGRIANSSDVMRRQIERLMATTEKSGMSINVIPFSAGAHPGINSLFSIQPSGSEMDEFLYLENPGREINVPDDQELIADYGSMFEALVHESQKSQRQRKRELELKSTSAKVLSHARTRCGPSMAAPLIRCHLRLQYADSAFDTQPRVWPFTVAIIRGVLRC